MAGKAQRQAWQAALLQMSRQTKKAAKEPAYLLAIETQCEQNAPRKQRHICEQQGTGYVTFRRDGVEVQRVTCGSFGLSLHAAWQELVGADRAIPRNLRFSAASIQVGPDDMLMPAAVVYVRCHGLAGGMPPKAPREEEDAEGSLRPIWRLGNLDGV